MCPSVSVDGRSLTRECGWRRRTHPIYASWQAPRQTHPAAFGFLPARWQRMRRTAWRAPTRSASVFSGAGASHFAGMPHPGQSAPPVSRSYASFAAVVPRSIWYGNRYIPRSSCLRRSSSAQRPLRTSPVAPFPNWYHPLGTTSALHSLPPPANRRAPCFPAGHSRWHLRGGRAHGIMNKASFQTRRKEETDELSKLRNRSATGCAALSHLRHARFPHAGLYRLRGAGRLWRRF